MNEKKLIPSPSVLMEEYAEALNEKGQAFEGEKRFSNPEYLCEGGCKKLFVLTDHWTERQIVKAIPKNESPETVEQFIYESQLLASLEHPNILPAYDVGSDDGTPFILMKLMEGDNLKDFLNYDPPLSLKLKIFEKICDAIAYCHQNEIVHLDLKPENIQVSPYFEVTVCDWGSARKYSDLDGSELGATPGYIAPEALGGDLSSSCDIYALGVLFYEILTGESLFKGSTSSEVLKANKNGRVNIAGIKDLSLKAICQKALNKEKLGRFNSVEDFQAKLNLYHQKLPVPEEKASLVRRCDLLIKRRPMAVGMTTVLLMFISLISLIFAMNFNQQKNKAEKLMNQFQLERDRRVSLSLDNSSMLHNQAWQAYKDGLTDEALDLLKISISASGYDKRKHELEGLIQLLKFNLEEARSSFRKAEIEENFKSYYSILPKRSELLNYSIEDLTDLVMKIRKTDSYFYHQFIGSIFTIAEFDDKKKEEFLNSVSKKLGFSGKLYVVEEGRSLTITGNAGLFPTYILRALRLKKLIFKNTL